MPHDLAIFDSVSPDFFSYSISSVDVSKVLTGRPYGDPIILWYKTIAHTYRITTFECDSRKLLALNVYLP